MLKSNKSTIIPYLKVIRLFKFCRLHRSTINIIMYRSTGYHETGLTCDSKLLLILILIIIIQLLVNKFIL
jgi:hypothetical protein